MSLFEYKPDVNARVNNKETPCESFGEKGEAKSCFICIDT